MTGLIGRSETATSITLARPLERMATVRFEATLARFYSVRAIGMEQAPKKMEDVVVCLSFGISCND